MGPLPLRASTSDASFAFSPPLYLMIGVLAVLTSCKLIVNSRHALFNASFFLFDFLYANVHGWSWFAGHTWSLAVEEQFYLVFPAVWILTRRIGREWVFSCAFFLSILWDLLPTISSWDGLLIRSGREGFACICCGVLIATFDARVRTIARAVPLIVVAAVALVLVWHPVSGTDWKRALYECIFVPPAISLLLIFSLEHRGWLSAFLRWRLVQAIGLTSYGIYLWQELFTAPFDNYVGSGERISFLLPLLFAVVPISWFFVEKPAMRLGRSLAQRVRRNPIRERTPMPAQVAPDFTVE
jgi:peptidoglycan/LPS O-acetylase OafA/YrhL